MYDFIIIGGGIVGLSTAWQLQQRQPHHKVLLLEKESRLAQHQTGHNSGVIHAGIYYAPGSLKAQFCRQGVEATLAFCRDNGIAVEQCGKLLVATNTAELERMRALYQRALDNGLEVELLDAEQLILREPHIVGLGAIYLATTGIVDYRLVAQAMAQRFEQAGGEIRLQHRVVALQEDAEGITVKVALNGPVAIPSQAGDICSIKSRFLIACSGLMADRTTAMLGLETDFQIIPYRGEYYRLPASKNDIVNHLIYPIPDPELPFLGVHLTRMIDGSVTVGPNAVQGWKREGYGRFNVSLSDCWQMMRFGGFWRVSWRHLASGLAEWRDSWWRQGYLKRVQKYCPDIELGDLQPYPAGVRAQAVLRDGTLVHDFLFAQSRRSLHVCNAPSPAATSAIPIGGYICDKVEQQVAAI